MNVPDSVHCSGCGAALGLSPLGAPGDLACPDCKITLEVFEGQSGKLRDCHQCGGQFVDHALLQELIERRETYGAAVPRRAKKWNPLLGPIRYLPCPACRELMARKNFGGESGVIIDVCPPHGVWFDTGELPRILAFVESGGLARARRRELEEVRKVRSARQEAMGAPAPSAPDPGSSVTLAEHAVTLIRSIGELLGQAWR